MTCRQVQSHLDDYILNQINDQLFEQIDHHLQDCLDCQKQLETNKQLISGLKSIAVPDPGDYYWQQLEESILTRTLGEKKETSEPSDQNKIEPVRIVQRYLIPLAASFILLLGSIMLSNSVLSQIQTGSRAYNNTHSLNIQGNSLKISERSDSQLFTAIVAATPGSLARHLIFANIAGSAGVNSVSGGSK